MNKPISQPQADPDIGPLDEDGQQIWSPEEEAAIVRMNADPRFQTGLARAEADVLAGRVFTHEEVKASMKEMKRRWFAEKGRTPPPRLFRRLKIDWTSTARADQHRIWMFVAEYNVSRADRIEAPLEARIATLAGVPEQGRPVAGEMRQLSIPDIQLVVRYRIVEREDVVKILQVWHTRENREEA